MRTLILSAIDIEQAAKRLPGVLGVLTGKDIAAIAKPIGNLITRKLQLLSLCGRSGALFRRAGRGRDRREPLSSPRTRSISSVSITRRGRPVVDPEFAASRSSPPCCTTISAAMSCTRAISSMAIPKPPSAQRTKVVSYKVDYPRVNSTPIETYGVIADFDQGAGRYTVWSNFQGPYAIHPIMCDALGVRGSQLRLISAPSSGGSFGIKQGVYPYIVLMGLASRKLGRAREMDRGPAGASGGVVGRFRARHHAGWRLRRRTAQLTGASPEADRECRRVSAAARSGRALPHAFDAERTLSRAQCRGREPGSRHQPGAERAQSRLRRAAILLPARTHDGQGSGGTSVSIRPRCGCATSCAPTNFPTTPRPARCSTAAIIRGRSGSRSRRLASTNFASSATRRRKAGRKFGIGMALGGRDLGLQHGLCQPSADPCAAREGPAEIRRRRQPRASSWIRSAR